MFIFAGVTVGCTEEPVAVLEQPSTDPNLEDGVAAGSPLYLKVGVQWESADPKSGFERMGNCSLPADATQGSTVNCTVSIPEGQLYYSNVNFDVGTFNANSCPIVEFRPYYYMRANTANFTPPGETAAIDCSLLQDKKCWGGAAPTMVTDFPKNTGYYFLTLVNATTNYTLPSENKTRWYGGDGVNYLVTNDLSLADAIAPVATGSQQRVGQVALDPNWYGYQVNCTDHWARVLYTINLTIRDENQDNAHSGPEDELTDWF
ncbi:hypothetical protein [Bdellovibrio bacteriovorus]|uniref:hypothetical protein n=1 Tax=Bdellovibrio bacteriovorus TaxID=959 RepID=UPI0035A92F19